MTPQYLQKTLEVAKDVVYEAGEELIKHFGNTKSEKKSDTGIDVTDIVTHLDRQIEDFIAGELVKYDSSIGFFGEEFGQRASASNTWLLDPIDGTSHFVRGIPFCTTMLALVEDHTVVLSVIYDFVRKNMYWAIKGQGAFCNNEPIHVSNRPLSQALLSFETNLTKPENLKKYLEVKKVTGTLHTINCGWEFIMVASGKLDGRMAMDPFGKDWDFAPGSLLVSEAGGKSTNIGVETYDYRNHDYLITNAVVHEELTKGPSAIFPMKQNS